MDLIFGFLCMCVGYVIDVAYVGYSADGVELFWFLC